MKIPRYSLQIVLECTWYHELNFEALLAKCLGYHQWYGCRPRQIETRSAVEPDACGIDAKRRRATEYGFSRHQCTIEPDGNVLESCVSRVPRVTRLSLRNAVVDAALRSGSSRGRYSWQPVWRICVVLRGSSSRYSTIDIASLCRSSQPNQELVSGVLFT